MNIRSHYFQDQKLETIYMGGGTPSILSSDETGRLIQHAIGVYGKIKNAEITIEANPEDVNTKIANDWLEKGFNRVSLGIQSLDENALRFLNRAHTRDTALDAIDTLRHAGFKNISIDIITGIPILSHEKLKENLEVLSEKMPEHFSVYSLTIEEKTLLGFRQARGKLSLADDHSAEQYELAREFLKRKNYFTYEVSNFAKDQDFISKHNSSYWKMKPYLGIGPSAHSFNGKNRFKNYPNNAMYMRALESGALHGEEEYLSAKDRFNDTIITGLRTMWGVELDSLNDLLHEEQKSAFKKIIQKLKSQEDIIEVEQRLKIPEEKYIISDSILIQILL